MNQADNGNRVRPSGERAADESTRKLFLDRRLQIIFGVTLMAVVGVASIIPVFPKMVRELNLSSQSIGLLITIFTLPGVVLAPVLGVLADRFGRKRILAPSLLLFGLAGGACAFTRNFETLLALRFVQGIGGASLLSLNVTLIGDIYHGRERTAAMGYNASILSLGTAGYPALGGALGMMGWYYPFGLSLLAIPIGFLVLFSLESPEPKTGQGLGEYFTQAWQCFRNRQVVGLFTATAATFIILYGSYLIYFPLLMGRRFQATPVVIGLVISGMSLITALTSSQLGNLIKFIPEKTLLKASFIIYALAMMTIPLMPSLALLSLPTVIYGIAHGLNFPILQTMLTGLAPMEYRAVFMSVNGMILRLGQTLGPLVMGAAFSLGGLDTVFYAGAAIAAAMFLMLSAMPGERG